MRNDWREYNYSHYDNGTKRVYYCGGDAQERMCRNGWTLMLSEFRETPEELFTRLSARYSKVKVYYDTTCVKGLHSYFAFVK